MLCEVQSEHRGGRTVPYVLSRDSGYICFSESHLCGFMAEAVLPGSVAAGAVYSARKASGTEEHTEKASGLLPCGLHSQDCQPGDWLAPLFDSPACGSLEKKTLVKSL